MKTGILNKYIYDSTQDNIQSEEKTIPKTASAIVQYFGQGALKGLEGVLDTPLIMSAGIKKLVGDEEGAKTHMEAANVSLTNMLINAASGNETNPYINGNQNLWNKEVDKNSYIKQNNFGGKVVSGIGEMLPTIAIGGGVKGTNLTKKAASNVLLGSKAFSEATNEAYHDSSDIGKSMLYGLENAGVELATEQISGGIPGLKQINGNTKKEILKNYAKSAIGEGVEEVTSSLVNPLLQTTYKGSEALNQYKDKDYWKDVLESGLVGTTIGGVLDSPNTIYSFKNSQNLNDKSTGINDLRINDINTPLDQNVTENGLKGNKILYNQNINKNTLYQEEQTNNQKINNFRESATQYNFTNTTETYNLFDTIEKIIQDKDYNIVFDDTIKNKLGNSVNAQIKSENNGIEIRINPNSNRTGEFLLTHEITHAIETEKMKNLIIDYASKHADFNESLEALKQTYGTNDVSSEVMADISGQLFGNQEFINNLSLKQPNIFKQIYNKIIELANKITGNSKESLFIKDLKNKWEEAYRNTTTEQAVSKVSNESKNHLSKNALNEVNDTLNNPNTDINSMVKLRDYTPKQLVSVGVKDLPMLVRKGHLRENILTSAEAKNKGYSIKGKHYHGLGIDTYMKAIDSLDNPIAVYQYTDKGNYSKDNFIVLTEVKDNSNNNIIVPIEIHKKGQYNKIEIDTNRIKTTYGRETTNYFNNMVKNGNLIKIYNKKRSAKLPMQSGNFNTSTVNTISQSNDKVNSNTSSTKYSMQNNENNTQRTENSSFSNEKSENISNSNIKYSMSDIGTHGTLMAIHNLDETKLKGILELGGFPVPSIAVTNPNLIDHKQYGNISVLFDKSTIDPSIKANEVYDRDVWSPTFPQVEYEINDNAIDSIAKKIGIERWRLNDYAENSGNYENLIERLIKDEKVIDRYVKENNLEYETVYKEPKLRESYHSNADVQKWIKDNDITLDKLAINKDLRNKYLDIIQIEKDGELYKTLDNSLDWYKPGDIKNPWLKNLENDLKVIKGEIELQPETDERKTNDNKRQSAINYGLKEYLKNEISSIYGKKGIRNDKEYLTPSGNRRSFWQLHDEYNLENIVNALTKGNTMGTQGWFPGYGQIQANMAHRFNSLEDIKLNEKKLMDLSTNNEILEELRNNIESDINAIVDHNNTDIMQVSELLADFARGDLTIDNFKKLTRNNYQTMTNVSDALIRKIIDDLNVLKDIPTDYFEAKPQRAVGLDEIEQVLIPNNASNELKKMLQEASINYTEYDPNIDGDRNRIINQFDDLKFSMSNNKWQEYLEKNYKATGTRTNMNNIRKGDMILANNDVKSNTLKAPLTPRAIPKDPTQENTTKIRKWSETVPKAKGVNQEIIKQVKENYNFTYVPQSNIKQVDYANKKINSIGYENSLKEFKGLVDSNKRLTANDLALGQRLLQEATKKKDISTASDLFIDIAVIGTEIGQATQALSIIKKLSPEGQLLTLQRAVNRMKLQNPKVGDIKITDEMISDILKSKNTVELEENMDKAKEKIAKQMKSTTTDKIIAWRYLSMLGNPKTHIRNIVSNVSMKGTIGIKNTIARTIETSVSKIMKNKGQERTKTFVKPTNEVKEFVNNYLKENSVFDNSSKYSLELELKKAQKVFGDKGAGKFIQYLYDKNSNALELEDTIFKNNRFKTAMSEYLTANKIKTKADIEANPNLVSNASLYAVEESLKATFQQYNALASSLNSLKKKSKAGEFVIDATMPFTKTPANILKTGMEYSPLGLAKTISLDTAKLAKGKISISQYIDNISSGLTGTGIMLLGCALAEMGILQASDDDDKEGKFDKAIGNQSYSIKIAGQTFTLDWLTPVAMPLFTGAELTKALNNEDTINVNNLVSMFTTTFDPLMQMSLLQGLNSALSGYDDNKLTAFVEESVKNYIGQMVPTLGGQIAKTIDPVVRSTSVSKDSGFTLGEQILRTNMAKIPGLTYFLEPATDVWGNEKRRSDSIVTRAFENFLAPYNRQTIDNNSINEELKKMYRETGEDNILPTLNLNKTVTYKGTKYDTDAKSYTTLKTTYGKTANEYLKKLFDTKTYKNSSNEDKAEMISKVYTYAFDKAKKEFLKSKGITYKNTTNDIKEVIDSDISLKSATYKRKNPSKYNTITKIGISYDDYYEYSKEVQKIKENTKTDTTTAKSKRKQEIFNYINSLKVNKAQKLALYNMLGNYSIKDYKNYMFKYINNLKLSKSEKEEMWKEIYGG